MARKDDIDELLISTSVDKLIKFIKKNKKVNVEEVSNALELPFITVEKWAKALEQQGLIRIEYKFTKEYLIWAGSEDQIIEKLGDISTQKKFAEGKVGELITKIKTANAELNVLKTEYTNSIENAQPMVKETNRKVVELKKMLNDSEKVYKKHLNNLQSLTQNYQNIKKNTDELKNELTTFKNTAKKLPSKSKAFKILKQFEDKVKQQKKDIDDKLKDVQTKTKEYEDKLNQMNEIKQKINVIEQKVEQDKEDSKKLKKLIKEVNVTYNKYIRITGKLSGGLPFEKKLGLYKNKLVDLNKMLNNVENKVEMIRTEINQGKDAADEAVELYKHVSEIDLKKVMKSLEERETTMEQESKKIKELLNNVKSSKDILSTVNNSLKDVKAAEELIKRERVNVSDTVESMADKIKDDIRELRVYDTKIKRLESQSNILIGSLNKHMQDHNKILDEYKQDKKGIKQNYEMQKTNITEHITKLKDWDSKYKKTYSKHKMINEINQTIENLKIDTGELENNLGLIKKKISLLEALKDNPAEQYETLQFIENKLKETKEKEKEVEKKRGKLKEIIEKMWKDKKENTN